MDNRVYISFGSVALIALFLIIYKLAYACCSIPVITSSSEIAFAGTNVTFKNSGDNRTLTWRFGDGNLKESGIEVNHVFSKPGEFQVTATYNGQCESQLLINIRERPRPSVIITQEKMEVEEEVAEFKKGKDIVLKEERPNKCKEMEQINLQEFKEICNSYYDENGKLNRERSLQFRDMADKFFNGMATTVYAKGASEFTGSKPIDFGVLSKLLEEYEIEEIKSTGDIPDVAQCIIKNRGLSISLRKK